MTEIQQGNPMDTIIISAIAILAVAVVLFGLDTFHRGPHR